MEKLTPEARQLKASDLQDFKAIRLEALEKHKNVFGSTVEKEASYSDDQWINLWLKENCPNVASFGLFNGEELIAITAIVRTSDDPSGKTAKLCASYIKEEYRGKGLSKQLYKARIDWAKQRGDFDNIIVSHRSGNEASRNANQAFGFTHTHSAPHTWPDGKTEDEVFYILPLKMPKPKKP
jgi:RimJ/RimL family protein N-acetyltransferase